jgi:hypothetical protein
MGNGTSLMARAKTSSVQHVLSVDAEQTSRLLMSTLAQYVRQEALLAAAPRPRGRLRALPTSSASHQVRAQSAFMRLASIVEAHTVRELVKRIEPHAPEPRSAILQDIYTSAEDRAIASWPSMIEAYKRWLGIRVVKWDEWNKLDAILDARNAIAHGVGELTRRQVRKDQATLLVSLNLIGIAVSGSRLEFSDSGIREVANVGRRFVGWLDRQL